jgi:hypothetical protein
LILIAVRLHCRIDEWRIRAERLKERSRPQNYWRGSRENYDAKKKA